MRERGDIILLSDIHLGAERDTGLFRADRELEAFLAWVLEAVRPACVVIAGDFLDLLVPATGESRIRPFDPHAVSRRAAAVVDHHPEVFAALGRIARSADHELFILSGNHDPELMLTEVRGAVERGMGVPTHPRLVRWGVDGEALRFVAGEASILVTHGDAFDDWNRIDHGALRTAANRFSYGLDDIDALGYVPPEGTSVVLNYVLDLRARYPWVDALKPEREAVFRILYQFLDKSQLASYSGLLSTALILGGRSWVRKLLKQRPEELIRAGAQTTRRERFKQWITSVRKERAARETGSLIEDLRAVAAENGYFDLHASDDNEEVLPLFLGPRADLLVAGHTHAAKARVVGERHLYLNTGTWARLLQLPDSDAPDETWRGFVKQLQDGADLGQARPTYVHIRSGEGKTRAALGTWTGSQPRIESEFVFDARERAWHEETRDA